MREDRPFPKSGSVLIQKPLRKGSIFSEHPIKRGVHHGSKEQDITSGGGQIGFLDTPE